MLQPVVEDQRAAGLPAAALVLDAQAVGRVWADDANSAEALKLDVQYFLDKLTPGMDIQQANPVAESLFPAGQVAMMPGGSFRAKVYADAEANIDVAPLPKGKVSSGVISAGTWSNRQDSHRRRWSG